MSENVGIIGIGIMGTAMARNIAAAGFAVVGYDPSPEAMQRLAAFGGIAAGSPREVAEAARITIMSLPSAEALGAAAASFAQAPSAGQIAVECSTLPLAAKHAAHVALAGAGMTLLDCPVSGTGAQAAQKDLFIFGSGDAAAFDACAPVFDAMSRARLHLGAFGNGS